MQITEQTALQNLRWFLEQSKRKQNHWFDALYNACTAGHYCGVRLAEEEVKRCVTQRG